MRNKASGGSGLTKKINEKGGFNEGHNKNRNSHRPERSGNWYMKEDIKGKAEGLSTLRVKEEKCTDSFMLFHKEVHAYVLENHKHPSGITYLVK